MPLYQSSVLKQHLKLQDQNVLNSAYKKYTKYFLNPTIQDNIRSSKEEEYQGIFLTELFVNILGYTLKPKADFNLVAEYKNQNNARKADGAILKNDVAIGVIELKGTNTKDLESIRKQAFDYKANQKGCVYVITSNFEKLRFYINDATEFEEFNLFELSPSRFALLYLCLQKDNIINNVPLKIKEASVVVEEQITKQFYKDYSLFKRELYRDLVKRNAKNLKAQASSLTSSTVKISQEEQQELQRLEKNVKLTLFKKSQKLIDRYLFIFFAEDRGLLPPNSTQQILDKWKADVDFGDDRPLYILFKQYFNFLDQGRAGTSKRAEIYAYNGGLFKEDKTLDTLEIDSELLYNHTSKLAAYDFESQVDVNILGHIFENSLNEIESVNAEIEGADFDKQTSKRKKDGVFYTPKYITKYIVENTIGKLCDEKKTELGFKEEEYFKGRKNRNKTTITKLVTILDTYRDWLLQLTICDPACGSGAFLNQALDFLIKEHTYIDELKTKVLGGGFQFPDIENTILENNIYGVDLNEESVEIAKLSLWLRTAQPRRKLNDLSSNIKCGNSLIDSKAVAGDKAFNWQEQFPKVFKEKDKKIYHVTTAIHDSRTSKRMVKYKVRELRDMGTNPYPNVIYFTPDDDFIISKTIAEIVKEDDLKILAYNICADHIHLLLACEIDDIPAIMQKIKGRTSFMCNKANNKEQHKGQYKGLKPLEKQQNKKPLWQQKYSAPKEVKTTEQLYNTIKYIQTNRSKHELPKHNKDVQNLIDSLTCTEAQAFKVEYKGGFDVVIGNPPYGAELKGKEWLKIKFKESSFGNIDSYKYFVQLGSEKLKTKGLLSYIMPDSYLEKEYFKDIRLFTSKLFEKITNIKMGDDVFDEVNLPTAIIVLEGKGKQVSNFRFQDLSKINKIHKSDFLFNDTKYIIDEPDVEKTFIVQNSIIKRTNTIAMIEVYDQVMGVKVYQKGKGKPKQTSFEKENNVFVSKENTDYFDFPYVSQGIGRYYYQTQNEFISYGEWLAEPRKIEYFNSPKIVIREIINPRIFASYIEEPAVVKNIAAVIINKNKDYPIKFLLGLINSKLLTFYVNEQSPKSNNKSYPSFNSRLLKEIPIPICTSIEKNKVIIKTEDLITFIQEQVEHSNKFQKYLKQKFQLEKLSKKLQNWHELEFGDFIKELNKAIKANNKLRIKEGLEETLILTKKDEFEWLDLFEENKQKAQVLQTQINQTDAEIDAMVYELYGLTEDEIAIVENS